MTSYTLSYSWQPNTVEPDQTPFYALKGDDGGARHPSADLAQERTSTRVADFLDVLRRLSSVRIETTPVEAEFEAASTPQQPADQARELTGDSEAERCATGRVRLLARMYVQGASTEHEARLAILTERLRQLLPPVTEDQWTALDEVAERLNQAAKRHQKIRDELGLK